MRATVCPHPPLRTCSHAPKSLHVVSTTTNHPTYRTHTTRPRTQTYALTMRLNDQRDEFLNKLAEAATEPTIMSYKATLDAFIDICDATTPDELTVEQVAAFVAAEAENKSLSTLRGQIASLSNFTAYCWGGDPTVTRARIYNALNQNPQHDFTGQSHEGDVDLPQVDALNDDVRNRIEAFLALIRTRDYGSRTHVIAELMTATGCRVKTAQQLTIHDYCAATKTIELPIPDTHAVSMLHDGQREATLPDEAAAALETYIDHERYPCLEDDQYPLFTTPHGRISRSTIHRTIKSKSKALLSDATGEDATNTPPAVDDVGIVMSITPSQLRKYGLEQV